MSDFTVERDEASAEFYDAASSGSLLIRRCPECGTVYPPQQLRCADSDHLDWFPASGNALLITWAVDHAVPLDPELATAAGDTSAYGIVELEEGPWMQVPIVGVPPDELTTGMSMHVTFVRPGAGELLPAFTRS